MSRLLDDHIRALFDHDEAQGEWYFLDGDEDNERNLLKLETVDHLTIEFLDAVFNDFDAHLAKFSPWQVATGTNYVLNNSYSNMCFAFQNSDMPIERRINAVGGLRSIFDQVFEPHCKAVAPDPGQVSRELNDICIMLWEGTPLMGLGVIEVSREGMAVMSHCLESRNPVVIQSGLHGLGHAVLDFPEAREPIEKYISGSFHTNTYLLDYAHKALTGSIL